jgi:hypothetical protein
MKKIKTYKEFKEPTVSWEELAKDFREDKRQDKKSVIREEVRKVMKESASSRAASISEEDFFDPKSPQAAALADSIRGEFQQEIEELVNKYYYYITKEDFENIVTTLEGYEEKFKVLNAKK